MRRLRVKFRGYSVNGDAAALAVSGQAATFTLGGAVLNGSRTLGQSNMDATTWTSYSAALTDTERAAIVANAVRYSSGTTEQAVSVEIRDGAGNLRASGTMTAPWATSSGSTITVGEVNASGITVSSGGSPDANWYCQFRGANGRYVRGTFGVAGSGRDFVWSLASFQTGSRGTLGTVTLTTTGTALPVVLTAPAITGTTQVGQSLALSTGTWQSDTTLTYARQWLRNGSAVSGQTGATYTLTGADLGANIGGTVTATNTSGSTAASASAVGPVVAAGEPTLVTAASIEYVGAFLLPDTWSTSITAMAYDPSGASGSGSLFLIGSRSYIAEISIPTLVDASATNNVDLLNKSSVLQSATGDIGGGVFTGTNVPGSGGYEGVEYHGLLVDGSTLVISAHHPYGTGGTQTVSHIRRSKTLSNATITGPKNLLGASSPYNKSRMFAGYMAPVPSEWQSTLGGTAVTGLAASSIVSTTSDGPSAAVFTPSTVFASGSTDVAVSPLIAYPSTNPPETTTGDFVSSYNVWTWASICRAVAIPNGTRSVVFFGTHGFGRYGYGTGTPDWTLHNTPNGSSGFNWIYDPTDTSNGEHAYPYRFQAWSYDINDVAQVIAGTRQPYACTPIVIPFYLPFDGTRGYAAPDPVPDARQAFCGAYAPDKRLMFFVAQEPVRPWRLIVHALRITNATAA